MISIKYLLSTCFRLFFGWLIPSSKISIHFWGKGGGLSNEFKMTQCSLRVFNLQLSDGNVTAGYLLISPFKGKLHSFVCLNSCAETSTYMKNKGNKEAIFKSHFRTQTFFSHSRYFLKLCYILANNFRHY